MRKISILAIGFSFFLTLDCFAVESKATEFKIGSGATPCCAVQVFSWTQNPLALNDPRQHALNSSRGAIEDNQVKWDPQNPGMALAGRGFYVSGDPFSSRSYGDYLVVFNLKPNQPITDLRFYGQLEDGTLREPAISLIRSESTFVLHKWYSQSGTTLAGVVRGHQNQNPDELPLDLNSAQSFKIKSPETAERFAIHKKISNDQDFINSVMEYSDHIGFLEMLWNSTEKTLSDKLIESAMLSEMKLVPDMRDALFAIDVKYPESEPLIDTFEYNDSLDDKGKLAELVLYLKSKQLLNSDQNPTSFAECKKLWKINWKKSQGFSHIQDLFEKIKNYKMQYGLTKTNQYDYPSTLKAKFKATCAGILN